jgi:hypothetical protein
MRVAADVGVFLFTLWMCAAVPLAHPQCPTNATSAAGRAGRALRLMTYNAAIQVSPGDTEDIFGVAHDERAKKIAIRILEMGADRPDVVVFQEVNAELAQDAMRDLLGKSKVYPSYVDLLDEHDTDNDSGLMLFSKFRFLRPDGSSYGNENSNGFATGVTPDSSPDGVMFADDFAFWYVYASEQTNGGDSWANKGVAFVRIDNPCERDRPFNLAFTHMQANGDGASSLDDYEDFINRRDQLSGDVQDSHSAFKGVRQAIELNIDAEKRHSQLIVVAGDFNINGNRHTAANVPDCSFLNDSCTGVRNYTEWGYTFNAPTSEDNFESYLTYRGFFSCGRGPCTYDPLARGRPGSLLTDSWMFETSELDRGATNSGSNTGGNNHDDERGHRPDYILHNRPKDTDGGDLFCVQHLRRLYSFTDPETGRDLSDHTPVLIDFNRPAPRCSPRPRKIGNESHLAPGDIASPYGPEPVHFNLDDPSDPLDRTFLGGDTLIKFPGSMQWYVIDQAFAYTIEVKKGTVDVAFEVYQGKDLSKSYPPWNGHCEEMKGKTGEKCTYVLTDPPYYVRVYAGNHSTLVPDRTKSGTYSINFHRLDCSSRKEACPLSPAVSMTIPWPTNTRLGSSDTAYFLFASENAMRWGSDGRFDNNGYPLATFLLQHDGPATPSPFIMSLLQSDGTPLFCANQCVNGFSQLQPASGWTQNADVQEQVGTAEAGSLAGSIVTVDGIEHSYPKEFLLSVARQSNDVLFVDNPFQFHTTVRYENSLVYFRPNTISCRLERTYSGKDDIFARWIPEVSYGQPCLVSESNPKPFTNCIQIGGEDWYRGTAVSDLDSRFDLRFLNNLSPSLWEDVLDSMDGDYGDQYLMGTTSVGDKIFALPKHHSDDSTQASGVFSWGDTHTYNDDTYYWYDLTYTLSHTRPPCRKNSDCPGKTCEPISQACK